MVDTKRIDLSNKFWDFSYGVMENGDIDSEDPGMIGEWYKNGIPLDKMQRVFVPSTWSLYNNRENFYHFGTGWYQTSIYLPSKWGSSDGKRVLIVFNGVNYKTTLWINGIKVGWHSGGYTKFWFNLQRYVKFGYENKLVIRVDNRYKKGRIPWSKSVDWMNYGGIYRTVYLKVVDPINIDDLKISNTINFNKDIGEGIENPSALINFRVKINDERPFTREFKGSLIFRVSDKEGERFTTEVPFNIDAEDDNTIVSGIIDKLPIDSSTLWSPDNPYLYKIRIRLVRDKDRMELDRIDTKWGIRDFVIHQGKFYLNNKEIYLKGINRHEDHPDVGNSMNPRLIYNDLCILKSAQVNCIRTSHYPQHSSLLKFADEMGFLIIEELPICNLSADELKDPHLLSNAQQQLWEMINRDKNNCSVIAWILGDFEHSNFPDMSQFITQLILIGKELDPSRYFSIAIDDPLDSNIMNLVDFWSINIFKGWYNERHSDFSKVSDYLTQINDLYVKIHEDTTDENKKPVIISAFGAGSISGFKDYANTFWSENYQYKFLREYLERIKSFEFISGTLVWHFQDFRCSTFGGYLDRPKTYNNKGIVDMHRNPKNAYYIIKEMFKNWNDKEKSI